MQLLSFARRAYHAVCLDLGPALATPALSALRDSRTIFLTTSCDAVSLQMAHERKHLLTQMGVGDRVAVLVTRRNEEKAPGASEIESYMGSPVCGVFDLRETGVQRSIEQSGRIPWSSSAGKNVERLAAWIAVHTVAGSLATVAR
jgi:Flp pilus assembly CpaE family ATPase